MTTEESDFWNDVHVSSGTIFQAVIGGERGNYFFYTITYYILLGYTICLGSYIQIITRLHIGFFRNRHLRLSLRCKMFIGDQGKGKKQDWAEGETELWCRSDKASASPLGSSGVSIAHQGCPVLG